MNNIIKIGPRFFQIEKQNYSNWRSALVREALQNATDSKGCTRIDVIVAEGENGTVKITIADNGAGMSEEVLRNVFLVMGETGKGGEDSIGGFGKARVLLCWAQESYMIQSHNYILHGCGAEYSITPTTQFYKGCRFDIVINDNKTVDDWTNIVRYVLHQCSLPQSVMVNGVKHLNEINKGRLVRQLSFANVFVNKSASPKLLIRTGGCWMFSKYLHSNVKAQIVVELFSERSRDVMTANRDGLQYEQDNELQAFLNELASDSKSSLKDKTRHFRKLVNRGMSFKATPKKKEEEKEMVAEEVLQMAAHGNAERGEVLMFQREMAQQAIYNSGANPIDEEYLPVYLRDPLLQAMMILNESNNQKKVQLINNFYHPEKWVSRDGTRYQLLREWFAVCQVIMDEVSNWTNKEFSYSIGWVFTDDENGEGADAMHVKQDEVNYLLLNPINEEMKIRYGVNNKDDWHALIVLGCHEATHCLYGYHDEDFSSFFTHLMVRVMKRRGEIFEAIKVSK